MGIGSNILYNSLKSDENISSNELIILERLINDKEKITNINMLYDGMALLSKVSYYINNYNYKDSEKIHEQLIQQVSKSISLDNINLADVKHLSGPIEINYYKNRDKKIIVMGDDHSAYNSSCDIKNNISIENYIDKLFKTDTEIDLFLEFTIPRKQRLQNKLDKFRVNWGDAPANYLNEVVLFGIRNYKKNITKRVHFTDNRFFIFYYSSLNNIDDGLETIQKYRKRISKNHDLILELKEYFEKESYLDKTTSDSRIMLDNIVPYLLKEIERSSIDIIKKIANVILKKITEYLKDYNGTNYAKLNNSYLSLNALIADTYTILRIMKNNEFKNCILYVGNNHQDGIKDLLNAVGFSFEKKINNEQSLFQRFINQPKLRCIRDIIPFDKYFKKN